MGEWVTGQSNAESIPPYSASKKASHSSTVYDPGGVVLGHRKTGRVAKRDQKAKEARKRKGKGG